MAAAMMEELGDSVVESFSRLCVLGCEASVCSRQLCNLSGVERMLSTEKDECVLLLAAEIPPLRMTPSWWVLPSSARDKDRTLRGAEVDDAAKCSFWSKSEGPLVVVASFLGPPAVVAESLEVGAADTHRASV